MSYTVYAQKCPSCANTFFVNIPPVVSSGVNLPSVCGAYIFYLTNCDIIYAKIFTALSIIKMFSANLFCEGYIVFISS